MSTVVLYCWCHSDSASVLLYFTLLWLTNTLNWRMVYTINYVKSSNAVFTFAEISILYFNYFLRVSLLLNLRHCGHMLTRHEVDFRWFSQRVRAKYFPFYKRTKRQFCRFFTPTLSTLANVSIFYNIWAPKSFGFRIFCWHRTFCHRNVSDLLLFLCIVKFVNSIQSQNGVFSLGEDSYLYFNYFWWVWLLLNRSPRG